jgi:Pyruvate/2-oxoacid:ferredoxin oxidoreductase delta subunit
MTGYWLKPISLRCVALIAQETEIPIAGCGGVHEWRDAAEMIMWGANCFQVNTSLILKGFHQIERIISGLEGFMEKMGYQSLSDFQGLALNHLTLPTEVTYADITFIVDENLCDACGACNIFGHCTAITIDDVAKINPKKCLNCGLCMQICPKKAITAHYH